MPRGREVLRRPKDAKPFSKDYFGRYVIDDLPTGWFCRIGGYPGGKLCTEDHEFSSFTSLCDHVTRYHGELQGEDVPIANRTMGWSQQPPSFDNPFRQPPPAVEYVLDTKGKTTMKEWARKKKVQMTVAEDGGRKERCRIL